MIVSGYIMPVFVTLDMKNVGSKNSTDSSSLISNFDTFSGDVKFSWMTSSLEVKF
jgi:hypothetical protein